MGKKAHFVDIEQKEDVRLSLIAKLDAYVDVSSLSFNMCYGNSAKEGDGRHAAFSLNINRDSPRYCPLCLKDDPVPYFRMIWHLPFVTVCPVHHVLLVNRCPSCYSTIDYWNTRWNQSISTCFSCKDSLDTNYNFITSPRNPSKTRYQDELLSMLETGELRGHKANTIAFFHHLYEIARLEGIPGNEDAPNPNISLDRVFQALYSAFHKILGESEKPSAILHNPMKERIMPEVTTKNIVHPRELTEKELDVAEFRYRIIKPYLSSSNKSTEGARRSANEGGIGLSTFYRWIESYKQGGLPALSPRNRFAGRRRGFLPEIEAMLESQIAENEYKTNPIPISRYWEEFTKKLVDRGYSSTKIPGRSTFRCRYLEYLERKVI